MTSGAVLLLRELEVEGLTRRLEQKEGELADLQRRLQRVLAETRNVRLARARRAIIQTIVKIAVEDEAKKNAMWALYHKVCAPRRTPPV